MSLSDFIELYLSIDLSKKEIELIKVRSFVPVKNGDELRQTVDCFRKAIMFSKRHYLKYRAKSHYALPESLEELLHLSPENFLLLVGSIRYGLNGDTLSLILKTPKETLLFQEQQLRDKTSLTDPDLSQIHLRLQPLEKKRFSQIQRIKNKFRPQRFLWETTLIMLAIIIVLWSIPELRNRYEKWIQKKTSEYFVSGEIKEAPIPPELNTKPAVVETDTSTTEEAAPAETSPKLERKQPKVVAGDVWRFSFTGSAKIDLENELKTILQKYSDQPPKSSVAPGGIQYDEYVKVDDLIQLKVDFESIADSQSHTLKMSWYKKKSVVTKKIPGGHVEVVVWISTI